MKKAINTTIPIRWLPSITLLTFFGRKICREQKFIRLWIYLINIYEWYIVIVFYHEPIARFKYIKMKLLTWQYNIHDKKRHQIMTCINHISMFWFPLCIFFWKVLLYYVIQHHTASIYIKQCLLWEQIDDCINWVVKYKWAFKKHNPHFMMFACKNQHVRVFASEHYLSLNIES